MRTHTEENLIRLKDDSTKKEMKDINIIEDLEQRLNALTHEKNSQMVQMSNEKEDIQRQIDFYTDKNFAMEEKIAAAVRDLTTEEEILRSNMEKLKMQ
jgi:hypothetical protein